MVCECECELVSEIHILNISVRKNHKLATESCSKDVLLFLNQNEHHRLKSLYFLNSVYLKYTGHLWFVEIVFLFKDNS